jgi:hypothetical protein
VMLCFLASANAAIVSVTVDFGTGGTSGFVPATSGSASLSSTFSGVVTLTATPSAGTVIYTAATPTLGIGVDASGTAADDLDTQIDGTEVLTLTFSGAQASSVIITNVILTHVQGGGGASGDGAAIASPIPETTWMNSNNLSLIQPLTGDTYTAGTLTYDTGTVSWANTVFTFATSDGSGGNDDYYLRSITFQYEDGVVPIPEPTTYALFGAGLIGLAAMRRFRARRG